MVNSRYEAINLNSMMVSNQYCFFALFDSVLSHAFKSRAHHSLRARHESASYIQAREGRGKFNQKNPESSIVDSGSGGPGFEHCPGVLAGALCCVLWQATLRQLRSAYIHPGV